MAESWVFRVYDQQQLLIPPLECAGTVELGRQEDGAERIYSKRYLDREKRWRVVIAGLDEDSVSRQHAILEPLGEGRARLANKSRKVSVGMSGGGYLKPGDTCELALPVELILGRRRVRIETGDGTGFQGLEQATIPPGSAFSSPAALVTRTGATTTGAGGVDLEELFDWLRAAIGVLQSAATSSDFFAKAAQAAVEIIGLDSGWVLLRDGESGWMTVAVQTAVPGQKDEPDWRPSQRVLDRVCRERRTFWYVPGRDETGATSLAGVASVVAAPILDESGQAIGALYGDRRRPRGGAGLVPPITKLEAMLVELLAVGVANGLARLEMEQAALSARVQFEQFFTADLAHQLAARPELLEGQDVEITVLFCDIRNFSRLSGHLGPSGTMRLINHVMGALSDCVLAHRGVLVDYIGDELMAMWGAPEEQPDHASLAGRAALSMIERLPELSRFWQADLGEALDVGIGVNTGVARVGNTGTERKFKYGPLGHTVNVSSRVQGLTKYLKARLLVTEATSSKLGLDFPASARRIGKVRVQNIEEPVELYEIAATGNPSWDGLCLAYEAALVAFEARDFLTAARILGGLISDHPHDGPSLLLLSRVVQCLVNPESFDPVFTPPGK